MKTGNLKDHELVKQFINTNDENALQILVNRHKDRIYTYILLIVKNQELAEDIVQDTFIKVINTLRRGKYQEKGVFLSWVMRIAHNLIIDFYRKEKNLKTYSNDDSEVDLFNSAKYSDDNVEELLVKDQITSDVRRLVDELPNDQKEVILLRHYGGLSFKEIADQTGVSINTALGRMRYALINLRKLIEKHEINLTIM